MKALAVMVLMLAVQSVNAADFSIFRSLVMDKKVVELAAKMSKEDYKLDEINDATVGVVRCFCSDIKLKFVKRDSSGLEVDKKKFITHVEVRGGETVIGDLVASEKKPK